MCLTWTPAWSDRPASCGQSVTKIRTGEECCPKSYSRLAWGRPLSLVPVHMPVSLVSSAPVAILSHGVSDMPLQTWPHRHPSSEIPQTLGSTLYHHGPPNLWEPPLQPPALPGLSSPAWHGVASWWLQSGAFWKVCVTSLLLNLSSSDCPRGTFRFLLPSAMPSNPTGHLAGFPLPGSPAQEHSLQPTCIYKV